MRRRDFVVVVLALASLAGEIPSPDPLPGLPRALQKRLVAFADVVARHEWSEALRYFDSRHLAAQRHLYFSPDFNEVAPNPKDPAVQVAFVDWYLVSTLGLQMVDNHVDAIDDVVAIRYRGSETPFGQTGPMRILLDIDTKVGPRTGWFFVDRKSLAFFGSEG